MTNALDDEVDANFDAFRAALPELMASHPGQFVLLRRRRVEGCFDSVRAATKSGMERFSDHLFSVQEINDRAADLGFFSHAVDTRIA